ncbi:hypothetical protein K466DRAFT_601356 [Polyporus arcularius HHB13444]|uniref:Uncharacterized protein n=1 Tax=Polyporus arcularius HHB13444 TaxID=1314778 RepID=A0A5C3P9E0_9APHY|nr:hypothetical protein K466DRAFT_601356 [Polyporus arcularius HHB13444]
MNRPIVSLSPFLDPCIPEFVQQRPPQSCSPIPISEGLARLLGKAPGEILHFPVQIPPGINIWLEAEVETELPLTYAYEGMIPSYNTYIVSIRKPNQPGVLRHALKVLKRELSEGLEGAAGALVVGLDERLRWEQSQEAARADPFPSTHERG